MAIVWKVHGGSGEMKYCLRLFIIVEFLSFLLILKCNFRGLLVDLEEKGSHVMM